MKTFDKDEYLLDLYLACNIAANSAELDIQEAHALKACQYLYSMAIDRDPSVAPESWYLTCIKQVLEDEQKQLNSIFNGCV